MQHFQNHISGNNIRAISSSIQHHFGDANEYVSPDGDTCFFVFEHFSFWQNSDMSCSILVDIWDDNNCFVKGVVSGGKTGLLRLDIFGREVSRMKKVRDGILQICHFHGWQMGSYPQQVSPTSGNAATPPPVFPNHFQPGSDPYPVLPPTPAQQARSMPPLPGKTTHS